MLTSMSLATLAAREPAVEVKFAGFQNQTRLSPYFHAADLLVLPSRASETWGLVVNEALMHGLSAVVSDRVGCGPDLVVPGLTGEVFPSDSIAGLAAALRRAISRRGQADVREACRERAARFSVHAAAVGIAAAVRAAMLPSGGGA